MPLSPELQPGRPQPMPLLPVLNTRPLPQADRFSAELRAVFGGDLQIVSAPLMRAEYLSTELPMGPFGGVVLTSETGAEAAARLGAARLTPLAWCVGDRTAEAAEARGFSAISASGDARDLTRLLAEAPDQSHLLYLHGEDRAADLAAALAPTGRAVTSLVVYRQVAQPLSEDVRHLISSGAPLLVPLYSPRTARLFMEALEGLPQEGVLPVVISENARRVLPEPLAGRAIVSSHPDGPGMLAAIGRCFAGGLA